MNVTKKNKFLLIVFASNYCYTVSDWEDYSQFDESAISMNADDSIIQQENGKQEIPDINNNLNNNEIKRLSSELLFFKEKCEHLSEEFQKSKFLQICDAITYNRKNNNEWLKKEITDFKEYLNMQDERGNTILHLVVHLKDVKILKYLTLNGANPCIKNFMQMSPADYVELFRNKKSEKHSTKEESKFLAYWDKYALKKNNEITESSKQINKFKELKSKFSKTINKFKKLKINFSSDQ